MLTRHKYKNIDWIDLESPTEADIAPVMSEFNLHPLLADELLRPSDRAHADPYGKYIYLIFHFPHYKHSGKRGTLEVDFIIGKNFIITSHYEPTDLFLDAAKTLETRSIIDKFETEPTSGIVFHHLMRGLYRHIEHELEHLTDDLASAEKEVFIGNEDKMVLALSRLNKILIDFRHPLKLHLEILESMDEKEEKIFGNAIGHYTEMVIGEYKRVWGRLENNRELLNDLRDTNDSLFSAKTNSIMKNLTIMSFLTLPLTLITGLFGMNTTGTPIVQEHNGFWIVLGLMGLTIVINVLLFRYNRWI